LKNGYVRFNNRKYINLIEKIIITIKKIFIKISIERVSINKYHDTYIILIPKYKKYNSILKKIIINQIKKCIISNKIENLLYDENVLFLSKEIQYYSKITEKNIMKSLIVEIINYIFNINKINAELENIYIFVNEYTRNNIQIIEKMCYKFKTVNIITENIKNYKQLENKLSEKNKLITVSNNKRKSVKNAKYVINIDFCKEKLEQYNLNMNSIIINFTNEKKFFDKLFKGVIINNIEVILNNNFEYYIKEIFGNIDNQLLLESYILNNASINVQEYFGKYNCKIGYLLGVRGKISEIEFMKIN